MMELDDLEHGIVVRMESIPNRAVKEGWPTEGKWTEVLLFELANLGNECGFYVCGKGCSQYGQGEWLYDLVWLQNEHGHVRDVPLILESEWSQELAAISEDFMKLLVGRGRHRVMVFQQRTRKEVADVTEALIMQVRDFLPTQKGDRYLFLGFDQGRNEFNSKVFVA